MRRIFWILIAWTSAVGLAEAQSAPAPAGGPVAARWDVAASIGLLSANPAPVDEPYGADWYFVGRYGATIGRYWTEHLKSELEFVTSNRGERYVQRYSTAPGLPPSYSYPAYERHTLRQVSGRMVWQFLDNAWLHPYVFGGVVYDADRVETFVPPQFYYPDPRTPGSQPVVAPAVNTAPETVHRVGITAGAGAKIYLTPSAFFNAALVVSHAKPARTATVIGGFGIDF